MADPLSAGIAGVLGVGSSILSNIGARKRQRQADAQNIKFWEMQNAYNTPKQQMSRLKDAGLNPNLIYGAKANTGIAGAVAPSKASPYNVKDPTPTALQAAMLTSQINLQNSQAGKNNAEEKRILGTTPFEVDQALSRADQLRQEAVQQKIKTEIAEVTTQDAINKIVQEALLMKAKTTEAKAKAAFTKKMLDINVNPNAGVGSQIQQFIFGTTKDAIDFLRNKNNYQSIFN
jgi:hypothetical protein